MELKSLKLDFHKLQKNAAIGLKNATIGLLKPNPYKKKILQENAAIGF